jgi:hypothetical protein
MNQGTRTKPLLLLFAIFGLMPLAFIVLVFLPARRHMAADEARLEAAIKRNQELPNIQPLTSQERALLEDPAAPWRTRIPSVGTDAQRLAHYYRVITELQRGLKARNVLLLGVRSTWTPIQGSYTLPPTLGAPGPAVPAAGKPGPGQLQAWALEAQVNGTPRELFQALEVLPTLGPLLEPVALRWEAGASQHTQMIILRNLVTTP